MALRSMRGRPCWSAVYCASQLAAVGAVFLIRFFGTTDVKIYDRRGRPVPPQVCVDFIIDTWERSSGSWWAPLEAPKHAVSLYDGSNGDADRERVWTYLSDGPYANLQDFRLSLETKARSEDPLFFAGALKLGFRVGLEDPETAHGSPW